MLLGLIVEFVLLFPEIVDGNVKMTLGMIWTIILRFAIQDITVEGEVFIATLRAHIDKRGRFF